MPNPNVVQLAAIPTLSVYRCALRLVMHTRRSALARTAKGSSNAKARRRGARLALLRSSISHRLSASTFLGKDSTS